MIDLKDTGVGLDGYALLSAQLESLLADERDFIANAAQFSAFLSSQLDDLNWAGFYLNRNEELVLGPFQGQIACVRIPWPRRVRYGGRDPADPARRRRPCLRRAHRLRQRVEQRAGSSAGQGRAPDRRARPGQSETGAFYRT